MDIKETVQKVLQEMVVPDLSKIMDENSKILALLDVTNKRLDDMNTHLADQSRRIDAVHSELSQRIEKVHSDLIHRLDANNVRIDRFFETGVTKYEHGKMDERVARLEREVEAIKQRVAA